MHLETQRLILRDVRTEDVPHIQKYFGVWEVIRWIGAPVPWPYEEGAAQDFYDNVLMPKVATGESYAFGITLKGDDTLIGAIEFEKKEATVFGRGFWLGVPFHGKGYMTEAVTAATRWMFEQTPAETIQAYNSLSNVASRRVKEKQGFAYQGVREAARAYHNGDTEEEIWTLAKEDFLSHNSGQ